MTLPFTLADLLEATSGILIHQAPIQFAGVTTDTRVKNQNKIFFALKGETYDANDYLFNAIESGAAAIVTQRELTTEESDKMKEVTVLQVTDTLVALQKFAQYWRNKSKFTVIGIAGSNGKTTTKNFTATLASARFQTFCTQGNLNNHIGVPLTLLSVMPHHKVAVVEMGMNHPGELKFLTELVSPDICLVTTIAHEHIEFFGSLEKIAEAEEEIYKYSRKDAIRIFNLDDPFTKSMYGRHRAHGKSLTFSSYEPATDVILKEVVSKINYIDVTGTIGGEPGSARVPVFGRHNVSNLMAASCAAFACGVAPDSIWKKLVECKGEWGRGQLTELQSGTKIIFDAYNANLESSRALIDNFGRLSITGKRVAVFADMLELGEHSPKLHEEWGRLAGAASFDVIWFYGKQRENFEKGLREVKFSKRLFISTEFEKEIAAEIGGELTSNDVVMIKGSRGMKLERVLEIWHPVDFHSKH